MMVANLLKGESTRRRSCVLVFSAVRNMLLKNKRIYLHYAAFTDQNVVMLQVPGFKFKYIAKDCKVESFCGYCSDAYEMKN